jgi:hypothetical protein
VRQADLIYNDAASGIRRYANNAAFVSHDLVASTDLHSFVLMGGWFSPCGSVCRIRGSIGAGNRTADKSKQK